MMPDETKNLLSNIEVNDKPMEEGKKKKAATLRISTEDPTRNLFNQYKLSKK